MLTLFHFHADTKLFLKNYQGQNDKLTVDVFPFLLVSPTFVWDSSQSFVPASQWCSRWSSACSFLPGTAHVWSHCRGGRPSFLSKSSHFIFLCDSFLHDQIPTSRHTEASPQHKSSRFISSDQKMCFQYSWCFSRLSSAYFWVSPGLHPCSCVEFCWSSSLRI